MKKNLTLVKQKRLKALDYLAQHSNPIIRQHAAELLGGIDVSGEGGIDTCPDDVGPGYLKGLHGIIYNKGLVGIIYNKGIFDVDSPVDASPL
jgi:hypothetical protein